MPGGEPRPASWPGRTREDRLIALYRKRLADAVVLDGRKLVAEWDAAGRPDPQRFMAGRVVLGERAQRVLQDAYWEGGAIGAVVAEAEVAKRGKQPKAPTTIRPEWGDWRPGDPRAAEQLVGRGQGLKRLLDRAGVTIRSVNKTRLGELARILAYSVEQGLGVGEVTRLVGPVLRNPRWAEVVANTEIRRAVTAASLDRYRSRKVELVTWSTSVDPCPVCEDNSGEAVKPGAAFSSGDDGPPAHPNCGCVLIPVV